MRHKKTLRKQTLYRYYALATLFWLLQKNSLTTKDTSDTKPTLDKEKTDFSRIRCPLCQWKPTSSDRWWCSDCEYPEYFWEGCGKAWNTFTTRGLCPGCNHQWRWTSCLACSGWSLHEDWYVKESS